ncbi:MAG TPA: CAP domain-containing protein [Chloroflexota bacterium]
MTSHSVAGRSLAGVALAATLLLGGHAPAASAAPSPQATETDPAGAPAKTEALALLINRARVREGLKPLARNADLDRAAEQHSQDMVRNRYLDHTAPDGSEPMDRAIGAGYGARPGTGWIVVEVISAISGEPEGPLNWWLNESPNVHGKVLRNPRWREMGVGYASGGEYGNYWTVLVGCQPGVLPGEALDGQTYRHTEDCDHSTPPPPAKPRLVGVPGTDARGANRVEVRWEGLPQPLLTDWIGLFRADEPDRSYRAWSYLSCTSVAAAAPADGTCSLPVASTLPPGQYEVRLFRGDGFVEAARSAGFVLEPKRSPVALSTQAADVRAGERLGVTWRGVPAANRLDWIGLYSLDRPDRGSAAWLYVSCLSTPVEPRSEGSCELAVPPTAEPGRYEVRFFADDAFAVLASTTVSVAAPAGAPDPAARQHTDLEA